MSSARRMLVITSGKTVLLTTGPQYSSRVAALNPVGTEQRLLSFENPDQTY